LTPAHVTPSRPDFEVVGAFNPAIVRCKDEVVMLLRVAEAPRGVPDAEVAAPLFDPITRRIDVRTWKRDASGVDTRDSRVIVVDGETYLTSISHLRRARSADGVHFDVDAAPALAASDESESFGIEDARITPIGSAYWVNYTAVSPGGIATAFATTSDMKTFERRGIAFAPPNRDVTVFPERIAGRFVALHRPMPEGIGRPSIWIATSEDGIRWGDHRLVAGPRPGGWDDLKIGGGAVPFRVRWRGHDAWLAIYHGVRRSPMTYALGALALDAADPARVLGRSPTPILAPEAAYETGGFFGNVVFTCGALVDGEDVRIYYGAADGVTAVADLTIESILEDLQ
jgi:predicted GH43/DUF377 family glycosyl hydrolase